MRDALIVEAVRTASGRKSGKLPGVRPDDLAAHLLRSLVSRAGVAPAVIEDVILGCVDQIGERGFNIARDAALIAGLPFDVCGVALDRMCGSGQQGRERGTWRAPNHFRGAGPTAGGRAPDRVGVRCVRRRAKGRASPGGHSPGGA